MSSSETFFYMICYIKLFWCMFDVHGFTLSIDNMLLCIIKTVSLKTFSTSSGLWNGFSSSQGLHWCSWGACIQPFKGSHHRPHDYWFWFLWQLSWNISWLIFYKLENMNVEKKYFGPNMLSGLILHLEKIY